MQTAQLDFAVLAQIESHWLLQQKGSAAQIVVWQVTSLQPFVLVAVQQEPVDGGQAPQSDAQLEHVSPALALHAPSPQNSQTPQSAAQVLHFSKVPSHTPSPHSGANSAQMSH